MNSTKTQKVTPAYVAFETFRNFIGALHEQAVPPTHIDKSLMHGMSGAVQSHLLLTLKFLKLIDEKGGVSADLKQLVAAFGKPEDWCDVLRPVTSHAYEDIIGDLDIETTTAKRLYDSFRAATPLEGTMLERAVRFYIKALKDAKVVISPYLVKRKPRTQGKRNQRGAGHSNGTEGGQSKTTRTCTPPAGTITIPVYLPGKPQGTITVPEALDLADCTMINAILTAYAKRISEVQ